MIPLIGMDVELNLQALSLEDARFIELTFGTNVGVLTCIEDTYPGAEHENAYCVRFPNGKESCWFESHLIVLDTPNNLEILARSVQAAKSDTLDLTIML